MDMNEMKELIVGLGSRSQERHEKNDERFDALRSEVDQLAKAFGRSNLPMDHSGRSDDRGYTKALGTALRKAALGDDREIKAMSVGTDPEGGYLVIPAMDSMIRRIRDMVSPMSTLVRNIDMTGGAELLLPFTRGTLEAVWVGENTTRTETDTVDVGEHRIALHEVYALPKVSQKLLDTANFDIGELLVEQIGHGLASAESVAFHSGNGVARPRGFTTYTTAATDDSTREWGVVQHIATGTSGAFSSSTKGDVLVDAVSALAPQYRPNAKWVMSRSTAGAIYKMKEATSDRYLWEPSMQSYQPDRLLGYPVVVSDDVPAIAANSLSVWFGDWRQAYCSIRMPGVRLLRDPYSIKGQVLFYAYQRVGGLMVDSNAVKAIKFASS